MLACGMVVVYSFWLMLATCTFWFIKMDNILFIFQGMYDGFVRRARAVEQSLREPTTRFVLVTTAEPLPSREAARFAGELAVREFSLGAVVVNRLLAESLRSPAGAQAATWLARNADEVGLALHPWADPTASSRVIADVAASYQAFRKVAAGEALAERSLTDIAPALFRVPRLGREISDIEAVADIARHLMA